MKPSSCPACGGALALDAQPGRATSFGHIGALSLPCDLLLPTCRTCRTFLVPEDDPRLQDVLRRLYREELRARACELIEVLAAGFTLCRLERVMGLSQGYLSGVRTGRNHPSAQLVSGLLALVNNPALVEAAQAYWARPRAPARYASGGPT